MYEDDPGKTIQGHVELPAEAIELHSDGTERTIEAAVLLDVAENTRVLNITPEEESY